MARANSAETYYYTDGNGLVGTAWYIKGQLVWQQPPAGTDFTSGSPVPDGWYEP